MDVERQARGERIRYARGLRGWNQDQLVAAIAEAGGTASRTKVSSWESGAMPRGDAILHLAEALDASPEWVMSGQGPGPGGGAGDVSELDAIRAELARHREALERAGLLPPAGEEVTRPAGAAAARSVRRGVRTPQPEAPGQSETTRRAR